MGVFCWNLRSVQLHPWKRAAWDEVSLCPVSALSLFPIAPASFLTPSPPAFGSFLHCCSVLLLFICSLASDSLRSHVLHHARLPCPSLSPGVCSSSCPLSWWCHPTISSSVISFSSCPQSFPTSGSLPMSRLFASGGLSVGASASASVLPMNIQSWFPLGFIALISLLSKAVLSNNQFSSWGETLRVGVFASGVNIPTVGLPL